MTDTTETLPTVTVRAIDVHRDHETRGSFSSIDYGREECIILDTSAGTTGVIIVVANTVSGDVEDLYFDRGDDVDVVDRTAIETY